MVVGAIFEQIILMQSTEINLQQEQIFSSQYANLFCFLGGFFINLFQIDISPRSLHTLINYVTTPEGLQFIAHSIIGGFVALGFKLFYQLLIFLYKRIFSSKNDKEGGKQ